MTRRRCCNCTQYFDWNRHDTCPHCHNFRPQDWRDGIFNAYTGDA